MKKESIKLLFMLVFSALITGCSSTHNQTYNPQQQNQARFKGDVEYKNQKERFYQELKQIIQDDTSKSSNSLNTKEKEDELFIYKQLMQQNL